MKCVMVCIMGYGLGMASALIIYAWLEHSMDRYALIPWSRKLETCIKFWGKEC